MHTHRHTCTHTPTVFNPLIPGFKYSLVAHSKPDSQWPWPSSRLPTTQRQTCRQIGGETELPKVLTVTTVDWTTNLVEIIRLKHLLKYLLNFSANKSCKISQV
jgi:hypothetical protein